MKCTVARINVKVAHNIQLRDAHISPWVATSIPEISRKFSQIINLQNICNRRTVVLPGSYEEGLSPGN